MTTTPALRLLGLRAALFGAAIAALLAAPAAQATTYTYSGAASGDVAVGTNWTPSGPPTGTDIAEWTAGSLSANFTTATQTWGEIQVTNPSGVITLASATNGGFGLTLNGISNTTGVNVGIDMSGASKGLTMANLSLLTLANSQTWLTKNGDVLTLGGNGGIAFGTSVLTIDGGGVVTFNPITVTTGTKSTSSTGSGIVINGSTLALTSQNNFFVSGTTTYTGPLGTNTALTINGSTFTAFPGPKNSNVIVQTFTVLNLDAGASSFQTNAREAGAIMQTGFTTVSRNAGGIVDYVGASGNQNQAFKVGSASSDVNGYATYNGNDWSVGNSTGFTNNAATYTNDAWASTNNTTVTVSSAPGASSTTKDLRFNNAGAFTVTLSGTNIINTGGILVGSTVAGSVSTITGGSLTSGDTNADGTHDLIIIDNNTGSGNIVINSAIVDNGVPTGITEGATTLSTVTSSLVLGGANSFTGPSSIDGGSVELNNASAWGGDGNLTFAPRGNISYAGAAGTFTLNGNSISVSGLATTMLGFNPVVQNANASAVTLTLNPSNSMSFNGTLKDGTGGGSLGVAMTGTGTQTLSGVLSYSGPTSVATGGHLVLGVNPTATSGYTVNGTLDVTAGGGITINSTTTSLSGTGSVLGSVTLNNAAVVTPGGVGAFGTLTVGNLTANSGSSTNFELSPVSGGNDEIAVTSALTFGSTGGLFNLYTSTGAPLASTGIFTLFTYGSGVNLGDLGTASILNPVAGLTYTFTEPSNDVVLTIGGATLTIANWILDTSPGDWTSTNNWNGSVVPNGVGTTANFIDTTGTNGAHTVNLSAAGITVGSIGFNTAGVGSTYTISGGNTLIMDDSTYGLPSITDTQGNDTISAAIQLNENTTVTVSRSPDTLTLSGAISDPPGQSLTKTGAGTLDLGSANSYSGGTYLNGGIVNFVNGGLGTGALTFNGGELQWNTGNTQDVSSLGITIGTLGGAFDPGSNTVTLASPITGTGPLTVSGSAGVLALTGTNSGFSGPIDLNGSTLQFTSLANLGTDNTINFNGGALQWASGNTYDISSDTITIGSGGATLNTNGQTVTLGTSAIGGGGSGSLTVLGGAGGNLILTKAATYTGSTTVTSGTLTSGIAGAIPATSLTVGTGATFNMAGFAQSENTIAGSGNIALGGGTLTVGGSVSSSSFAGGVTGAGTFTKAGSGTVAFSGTSNSTATVNVSIGTLEFDTGGNWTNAGALNINGGSVYMHGGNYTTSAASFVNVYTFNMDSGIANFAGGLSTTAANADGAFINITGGAFSASSVSLGRTNAYSTAPTAAAPISAVTTSGFYVNGSTANVTLGNLTIGESGSNSSTSARVDTGNVTATAEVAVSISGGGRWNILQVNNPTSSFTSTDLTNGVVIGQADTLGEVYVSNGATFTANKILFGLLADTIGGTGWLILGTTGASTGNLYVGAGGIGLGNTTDGFTANVALTHGLLGATSNWSSSLPMVLSGNATSFSIQAADSSAVAHNITLSGGLSGAGALNETGAGVLTLGGTNAFTGATNIAGNLRLVGSLTGTSGVAINSGGILSGNGTISSGTGITINSGGTLTPTDSTGTTYGILTSGVVLANSGSNTNISIGALTTAGTDYSQISVGTLTYGGDLNFNFAQIVTPGNSGDIFNITGTQSGDWSAVNIAGAYGPTTLADTSGVWTGQIGSTHFTFTDSTGVLSVVPEPSVYALVLGGIALLAGLRRRRSSLCLPTSLTSNTHDCTNQSTPSA